MIILGHESRVVVQKQIILKINLLAGSEEIQLFQANNLHNFIFLHWTLAFVVVGVFPGAYFVVAYFVI